MSKGMAFLMYHELGRAERPLCEDSAGYIRYVVDEAEFREQLQTIVNKGICGWSVSEALEQLNNGQDREGVCFTFDDGCETDLEIAAPLLREKGFNATFYVTVAHVDRKGYMSASQLRELADMGFEIGSHALTHRYITDLPPAEVEQELLESKARLEQMTGRRIAHFSCPGGRVNSQVVGVARSGAYQSVATSRLGLNKSGQDRYRLSRIPVKRGMTARRVGGLIRGEGLLFDMAQDVVLSAAKKALGNGLYERVRVRMLRSSRVSL